MKTQRMKRLSIVSVFVVAIVMILPFQAYSSEAIGEEIKCFLGDIKMIPVNNPVRLAIGNPNIADVSSVSKTEVAINPRSVGNTTFIVWDNFGEQPYNLRVFAEDTSIIKRRADNLLSKLNVPDVYTKAEDEEGKVLLLGTVKSSKDKEKIATAFSQLKDKMVDLISVKEEESVLEIDVQVIELNKGAKDTIGFTWPGSINFTEVGSPGISAAGTTWGKVFKVSDVTRGVANPFTLKLDALIQEGKARILSRPRLSCQSGKEAKLVVGGEVPVLSGTVTPGTSGPTSVGATTGGSVQYKEYGIILNINPRLEDSGRIHLNLDVQVSEVGEQVSTTYALAYTITKRTASTELFLDDGQTMAIGGLIKKKTQEDLRRMPWLSDVPVLGSFFRQRTTTDGSGVDKLGDTELFITLTPHVVSRERPNKELRPKPVEAPAFSDEAIIADPVLRYSKIVQKKVMDNLSYPEQAKEASFQGTVKLSLKFSHVGELLDVKLKESSHYRVLDDDALKTAKETAPYPPFPPGIKEKELWVDIPIIYRLE